MAKDNLKTSNLDCAKSMIKLLEESRTVKACIITAAEEFSFYNKGCWDWQINDTIYSGNGGSLQAIKEKAFPSAVMHRLFGSYKQGELIVGN